MGKGRGGRANGWGFGVVGGERVGVWVVARERVNSTRYPAEIHKRNILRVRRRTANALITAD